MGYECFCYLVEFFVAAVGSDEAAADCDDPVWARHLQLEVGVMGYGHEASESWSPEDCVVLRRPVDHFKVKCFLAEVCRAPKDYLQAYPSEGVDCFSWYDPVEGCASGLECVVLDEHVVEC